MENSPTYIVLEDTKKNEICTEAGKRAIKYEK